MNLPKDMSREAVARWLWEVSMPRLRDYKADLIDTIGTDDENPWELGIVRIQADAVRALVEVKVWEAAVAVYADWDSAEGTFSTQEEREAEAAEIVQRILGGDGGEGKA